MRPRIVTACVFSILLMTSFATPQEPRKASIEGVVGELGTGVPIPNARVILTRAEEAAPGLFTPPSLPATTTDREGKYALGGLEAATYRVTVAAEGFARQSKVHALASGQALKDVRVTLTPTGTVTGHIRYSSGQPAAGVQVQLVSPVYGPDGERRLTSAGAGRTNDRGEYRVYWVTPGQYYVVAGSLDIFGSFQSIESGGLGGSPNEYQIRKYGVIFHPGVSDPNDAAFVTVQSGIELKLDLVVPQQVYRIRGRVVDTRTGRWPASAQVTLGGRRLIEGGAGSMLLWAIPVYNPADGTFTLKDVMAGEYILSVVLLPPTYYIKQALYDGSDVLNGPLLVTSSGPGALTIVLSSKGGQVTGTVVDAKRLPARGVQAVLVPDEHRDRAELYKTAMTDDAGRITLTGIAPGNYKLFAWEALEPYAYYDPKVIERFEQQGTPVHVTETSTVNVDVRVIPPQ